MPLLVSFLEQRSSKRRRCFLEDALLDATGDYTNHMVWAESDEQRRLPLVTIDTGENSLEDLSWLAKLNLPSGVQVEYGAMGSRGDFLLRRGGTEVAAVCDLESGEFVLSAGARIEDAGGATRLLLELIRMRLGHLRVEPASAGQSREGSLRPLARLTDGTWFPFESLRAL